MVTNINAKNDWKFDFSSLPKWDVRDRIPFIYDKFYPLPECDALCCIYSIAEVKMGCYQGFLAILKNKDNPELLLNISEKITFCDNFSVNNNGDVIFLQCHIFDKVKNRVSNLVLILDIVREKFSYFTTDNYNPCYKVVELGDGVFGIEADEFQRNDKRLDAFCKTRIDLHCLDWYDFKKIGMLPKRKSNMFRKLHEKRRQEKIEIINKALPDGASLVSFDYKNIFYDEDYNVEIKYSDKKHVFYSIKGNIYYDDKLYCNSGYHYFEKESTFGKLLDVIKQVLS